MASDKTIIAFMRIDLQDAGGEPSSLRLHTGLGTYYPKNSKWSDYLGTGGLISIDRITDQSDTSAQGFTIKMTIPNAQENRYNDINLFDRIRSANLENRGICIHAAEFADIKDTEGITEPFLALVGQVANVEINPSEVKLDIYTGATLLNQVVGGPSRYTDLTHRRFVDRGDTCMRFINDTTARDALFP